MYIKAQLRKQHDLQQGMTLLEVLVAILILSFGLLGMIGLIMNGLKITSSSHYRTIAAQQLSAMADTINANPYIVSAYAPPASSTVTAACLTSSGCTSGVQFPATDYGLWRSNVTTSLPNGAGIVCLDDSPSDGASADFACDGVGRLTVKVCWNESARISVAGGGASGGVATTDSCLAAQL